MNEVNKINEERETIVKEYAQRGKKLIDEYTRMKRIVLLDSFPNSAASVISSANEQPGVAVSSSYSL